MPIGRDTYDRKLKGLEVERDHAEAELARIDRQYATDQREAMARRNRCNAEIADFRREWEPKIEGS